MKLSIFSIFLFSLSASKGDYICGHFLSIADIALSASIVSLQILSYDLSMFPSIEKWMENLEKLDYFGEANKGLKEWKRALEQRETEITAGSANGGLETLPEEECEELSVSNE